MSAVTFLHSMQTSLSKRNIWSLHVVESDTELVDINENVF